MIAPQSLPDDTAMDVFVRCSNCSRSPAQSYAEVPQNGKQHLDELQKAFKGQETVQQPCDNPALASSEMLGGAPGEAGGAGARVLVVEDAL